MTPFHIRLLGPVEIQVAGQPIRLRRKTRALLSYLAVTGKAHSRQALYDLFCQKTQNPASALRSLLSRIRSHLGAEALITNGDAVEFNLAAGWVDAVTFEANLKTNSSPLTIEALIDTINLYQGEFASRLSLIDAPEFEIWLLSMRSHYAHLYERGLQALVEAFIAANQYQQALKQAQALVAVNPFLEQAHAHLMWLYAKLNQRQAALNQFETCRTLLAQELAVEPTSALVDLADKIMAGQLEAAPHLAPAPTFNQVAHPQPTLVQRDGELRQLAQYWQAAKAKQGTPVLLEAIAGGGKTSLVHAFRQGLPSTTSFLLGDCYESAQALPHAPWIEILESHLKRFDADDLPPLSEFALNYVSRLIPALARKMNVTVPPTPPTSGGELERLFTAMVETLALTPDGQPQLIFVDNLQWADEVSLRFFHFFSRRISQTNMLLIGAFRSEETDQAPALQTLLNDLQQGHYQHLHLPPFELPAIIHLAEQLWPDLAEGYHLHICTLLAKATGGNPFFVTEILRELAQSTEIPEALPIPNSVLDLINRRLRYLPEDSRQVIEALAIIGMPTTPDQTQQVSARSEDETVAAIDLGLRLGYLETQAAYPVSYQFSHDLVREAIVQQMSDIRRRHLHRRAATMLEQQPARPATLVYHWYAAGDPEKTAYYAGLAGQEAATVYANDDAIRYLELALEHEQDLSRRLNALVTLGQVKYLVGQWDEAEAIFRQGVQIAQQLANNLEWGRCKMHLGHILVYKGSYDEALTMLVEAVQILERFEKRANATQLLGQTVGEIGIVYWYQGEYDQALTHFEKRLHLAQQRGDDNDASIAIANIGIIHWGMGDLEQAMTCFEQKLQRDEETGDQLSMSKALGNMGIVYRDQGQHPRAMDHLLRKLTIDTQLGDRLGVGFVLDDLGQVYWQWGDLAQAATCWQHALQITVGLGNWPEVSNALGRLAGVYQANQVFAQAEYLVNIAITLAEKLRIQRILAALYNTLTGIYQSQNRLVEAQASNDQALALATQLVRKEIQFTSQIRAITLQANMAEIDIETAINALENLRQQWSVIAEQATLHYHIWQLDETQKHHRQQAGQHYQTLYQQTPLLIYQQRYFDLTGETLPSPPALPALPAILDLTPLDIDPLMAQIEQKVDELAS